MNFNEYQEEAHKTAVYEKGNRKEDLVYLALGISGEAGEIANKIKKMLRGDYGQGDITFAKVISNIEVLGELGDILWYLSEMARHIGVSLNEVAIYNLDKLKSREGRGTIKGEGDDR